MAVASFAVPAVEQWSGIICLISNFLHFKPFKMSSFISLSKYIVLPVLTDWLSLPDMIKFDCSLVNRKMRLLYLDFIASDAATLHMSSDYTCKLECLKWVAIRTFRVPSLSMTNFDVNEFFVVNAVVMPSTSSSFIQCAMSFFRPSAKATTPRSLKFVFSSALVDLNLSQCYDLHPTNLVTISEQCSRLTSINLTDCSLINDESLIQLSQNCSQLHSVDISECSQVTDVGMVALTINCPILAIAELGSRLLELNIGLSESYRDCPLSLSLTSRGCKALVTRCSQLQKLDVSNRTAAMCESNIKLLSIHVDTLLAVDFTGINVAVTTLCELYKNQPHMTEISIYNKTFVHGLYSESTDVTEVLHTITQHCKQLTSLTIIDSSFDQDALVELLQHCTQVTTLEIMNLSLGLELTTLLGINKYGAKLQQLRLQTYAQPSIKNYVNQDTIFSNLNSLTHFEMTLFICTNIIQQNTAALEQLTLKFNHYNSRIMTALPIIATCKLLKKLSFSHMANFPFYAFVEIVTSCTQLEYITLRGCVTYEEIDWLIALARCKKIKTLCIYGGNCVSNKSLTVLTNYCKMLSQLELHSADISKQNRILQILSTNSPNLTYLSVNLTDNLFTEQGVVELVKGCKKLRKIEILKTWFTNQMLEYIVVNCVLLCELKVSNCTAGSLNVQEAVHFLHNTMKSQSSMSCFGTSIYIEYLFGAAPVAIEIEGFKDRPVLKVTVSSTAGQ